MDLKTTTSLILLMLMISLSKSNPIDVTNPVTKLNTDDYTLQNEVFPENYEIDLTIASNFETTGEFSGIVKIIIRPILNTQKNIKFHTKKLRLLPHGLKLYDITDPIKKNLINSYEVKAELEMVICKIKPLSNAQTYILELHYDGILSQDLYGFYRTSYTNEDGNLEWVATTHFEPVHARKAFPCFDEPNLKATFDIHITHPKEYHALSNTEAVSIETINQTSKRTSFRRTPKMSTYIIAFVISKFASISVNINDVQNAIWSRKEIIGKGISAFTMAPKILKAMETLTDISFFECGLTKLDNVVLPNLAVGGMENWGLITNRETILLWDPTESTGRQKQAVAHLLGHELAHQWFGNLVTMEWWSSTWLKEGFATFFEYRAVEMVEKHWEQDKRFVVEQHQSIFISDAWTSTQALTSDAFTPAEISSKFGSITYVKGGSIIRMLEHILGSDYFFEGVKTYLNRHRFKNTKPQDLWEAMSLYANNSKNPDLPLDLSIIMNSWTEQAGFPLVTVSASKSNIHLKQQRFLFNSETTGNLTWYIPISYTTSSLKNFSNTAPKLWLLPNEDGVIHNILQDENTWIILNIQETAYYRVNYDDRLWDALQNALREKGFGGIEVLNRVQIVDDAMNLARANIIKYERALDILLYLKNEIDYFPWYPAFKAFAYLRLRIDGTTELAELLNSHIFRLMQQLYNDVSFGERPSNQVEINKKVLALTWACDLGHEQCIQKSQGLFMKFKENQIQIDPNLRSIVYCTVLRHSNNSEDWKFLWQRLTDPTVFLEATTVITALGCSKIEELLYWYLQQSVDPTSAIKQQDAQLVFTSVVSGNPEGVEIGLQFLKTNFMSISENYGGWNALSIVITGLADRLTTEEQVNDLAAFIEANSDQLAEVADVARAAIESSRNNLEWVDAHSEALLKYLKEINKNGF